jgi:hypothetical protein
VKELNMIKLPFAIGAKKPGWPVAEFEDRLNALLRAASAAGVTERAIADELETHVKQYRRRVAGVDIARATNPTPITYDARTLRPNR